MEYTNIININDNEAALSSIRKMFPFVDDEKLYEIEQEDGLARLIVNRTFKTMLHLNGPQFDSQQTFDQDTFKQVYEEAYDMLLWSNDENEDAPMPESLKYTPPVIETDEENSEILPMKEKKKHTGAYAKVKEIVQNDIRQGIARKVTIQKLENDLGLKSSTSQTYYTKARTEM